MTRRLRPFLSAGRRAPAVQQHRGLLVSAPPGRSRSCAIRRWRSTRSANELETARQRKIEDAQRHSDYQDVHLGTPPTQPVDDRVQDVRRVELLHAPRRVHAGDEPASFASVGDPLSRRRRYPRPHSARASLRPTTACFVATSMSLAGQQHRAGGIREQFRRAPFPGERPPGSTIFIPEDHAMDVDVETATARRRRTPQGDGPISMIPALLIRTSSGPCAASAASRKAVNDSRFGDVEAQPDRPQPRRRRLDRRDVDVAQRHACAVPAQALRGRGADPARLLGRRRRAVPASESDRSMTLQTLAPPLREVGFPELAGVARHVGFRGLRGARPPRPRSSTRRIFPEIVFGSSANSSRRIRLYGRQLLAREREDRRAPSPRWARGRGPARRTPWAPPGAAGPGAGTTAASATAGARSARSPARTG